MRSHLSQEYVILYPQQILDLILQNNPLTLLLLDDARPVPPTHNSGRRVLHPELVSLNFSSKVARGASKLCIGAEALMRSRKRYPSPVRSIVFEVGRSRRIYYLPLLFEHFITQSMFRVLYPSVDLGTDVKIIIYVTAIMILVELSQYLLITRW
ncbi:Hypothetical_protein [Hexamita inflata]|uniref:Hypothetical_protein n=1 Tax=Hexamita inflata TaxID=28002 RepID=A0AA86R3F1_9EUKA|nr:Hypothetical protein HINF_LOCUS53966 [Hexamita inflata]